MGSYYRFVMNTNNSKVISNFIRNICSKRDEEQQKQAELNFLRYINLAEKINNRKKLLD